MNSGIDRAADDLASPTFDPLEVHYTRDRVVNEGQRQVTTKSKATSKGKDGKWNTTSHTGMTFLPIQHIVTDTYYKTPQVHKEEFKQKLATLQIGHRITRDMEGVRAEHVTMLEEPWPLGLTELRTSKAVSRLQQSPLLSEVQVNYPSCQTPKSAAERLGEVSDDGSSND